MMYAIVKLYEEEPEKVSRQTIHMKFRALISQKNKLWKI